jgi:hypothetical protein
VDILVIRDGADVWSHAPAYDRLGEIWESLGGKWGGSFKSLDDIYHLELEIQ